MANKKWQRERERERWNKINRRGGGGKRSWGKLEKVRGRWQKHNKSGGRRWQKNRSPVWERINRREKETEWGVKVEESRASICCFSTRFLPNTRRCGHLSDTLSGYANMSSRHIIVEDEKTDCGLVFRSYQLSFACLLRSETLHIPSVILSAEV